MKFIVFVIDSTTRSATGNEMAAIDLFNDGLRRDGFWVMAAGIGAPDTATLVDGRAIESTVTSASLFAHTEHYSGFWIIDVPSREVATRVASEGSRACNRRVELRPFLR